jgi:hypothetical protein
VSLTALDEIRIGDLVVRYADAVTRRDVGQWRATWARDATWHLVSKSIVGRAAIVTRWLELLPNYAEIIQLVAKGQIEQTSSGARGQWQVVEVIRRTSADHDCGQITSYTDEYVIEDGAWRFAARRLAVAYRVALPLGEFAGREVARLSPEL